MAAPVRFELTMSESESDALPLGYGAIYISYNNTKYFSKQGIAKEKGKFLLALVTVFLFSYYIRYNYKDKTK